MSCNCIKKILSQHQVNHFKSPQPHNPHSPPPYTLIEVDRPPYLENCSASPETSHVIIAFKSVTTGGLYLEQVILIHLFEDCRFVASLTHSILFILCGTDM